MKNFYLIYSEDEGVISSRVEEIISKLQVDKNSIITYNMPDVNLADIILDASMVSMFNPRKVIVVKNSICFKDKVNGVEELENYFESYNHNNYLIFTLGCAKVDTRKKIYKLISKVGEVITVKQIDHNYLCNYVNKMVMDNGFKMSYNDVNFFVNKVGTNLNNLKNELDKLMIYKEKEKVINYDDINDLVIGNLEDEIFALSDAVINGDVKRSLDVYGEFVNQNYEQTQMISILANQFRFLFQVKRLYEQGTYQNDIAKILEVHPYRVKLAISKCYQYEDRMLLKYLDKLATLEQNIKLGKTDKAIGLELFLINKNA